MNQDLKDFEDYCRGELHSPSHDTDAFPYYRINFTRRDAMLRVFSPTGFNVIFPANKVFESGFSGFLGFHERLRFGLGGYS